MDDLMDPLLQQLIEADAGIFAQRARLTVTQWSQCLQGLKGGRVAGACLQSDLLKPASEAFLSPGKRLRPLLASWAWRTLADCWDPQTPVPASVAAVGAAVELLHAASLVIDDIQDGSQERRGRPSLHATYGSPIAINVANWLYFEALAGLSAAAPLPDGHPQGPALALQRGTTVMSRCHMGQALDLAASRPETIAALLDGADGDADAYYDLAAKLKTAELMAFAIGAVVDLLGSVAQERAVLNVQDLAPALGLLYQQADDLRNVSRTLSGAKAGEDFDSLRNTVAIHMLRSLDRESRQHLATAARSSSANLAQWMQQRPEFRRAVNSICEEVRVGLQAAAAMANSCHEASAGYLNAVFLAPTIAIVDVVQDEVRSQP